MANQSVTIKVLGSGCANCRRLEALANEVVTQLSLTARVEHVGDFKEIAAYGVLSTPGLVIDEVLKSSGRMPSNAEVTAWVTAALAAKAD